jgi:hypothetical protein
VASPTKHSTVGTAFVDRHGPSVLAMTCERNLERWPSGRRRTPGKCVYGNVSRVRIPPSPPNNETSHPLGWLVSLWSSGFEPDQRGRPEPKAREHRRGATMARRAKSSSFSAKLKKPPKGGFLIRAFCRALGLVAKHIRSQVMATDLAIE